MPGGISRGKAKSAVAPVSAAAVARDRSRVVNRFINPVAGVDATGVVLAGGAGTAAVGRLATDGPFPDVQTCFQVTGTPTADVALDIAQAAGTTVPADGSQVNNNTGLLSYVSLWVKVVSAKTTAPTSVFQLYTYSLAATLTTVIQAKTVSSYDLADLGGWTKMEGFTWVPATTRNLGMRLMCWNTANVPVDLRVSGICIVVDPLGPVPVTPIGSRLGHRWAGAAHASASIASVPASMSKPHGFNELTAFRNRGPTPTLTITDDEAIALNKEVGADTIRNGGSVMSDTRWGGMPWTDRTQPINFDAWFFDPIVDKMRAAGLKWLPIAGGLLPWMAPLSTAQAFITDANAARNLADAVAFWTALVAHYRDVIVGVEWMNEPNLHNFWGTAPSGADYMTTLRAFYSSVKTVAPEIPVISGGLSPIKTAASGDAIYTQFLTDCYANGLKTNCDGIGLHAYPATTSTGSGPDANWSDGYDLAIYNVRNTMLAQGDGAKKIWLTELGWETNHSGTSFTGDATERQQAQFTALLTGIAEHDPRIACLMIHELINNPTTDRFQLFQADRFRRRRGFYALQEGFGAPRTRVWTPWEKVGDPGEPAYAGAYTAFGASAEGLRFRDNGETVQVRGSVKKGAAGAQFEPIITVPVGANGDADLRPVVNNYRPTSNGSTTTPTAGTVSAAQSGQVQWIGGDPTTIVTMDFEYDMA